MTGTYAWQSEQAATNNVYGNKDVSIPVELIKLEKLSDGTTTENPIANTVFYLYKEDGSQIGGQYVTDEYGKIEISLPRGNYYFREVIPSLGYTYDRNDAGEPITQYPFAVQENAELVAVFAYNLRQSGDLIIRKLVENTDGSPLSESQMATDFEFTVTFSDNGSYAYRVDGGEAVTLTSGERLSLRSGQSAVFDGIPSGVLYNVTEMPKRGYIVSATDHRGNIPADGQAVAEFVNRYQSDRNGTLTVSKEVSGEGADLMKEFSFTAQFDDVVEVFTLKHGETKEFTGLPIGTSYIITEQDASADGYTAAVGRYEGRVSTDEAIILPFLNIYDDASPVDALGSLTVSKVVSGGNTEAGKVFLFEVIFEGEGALENREFTLKAGETYTFGNLPHGVTYTVKEKDASGYLPTVDSVSGTIVGDEISAVTFTNVVPESEQETVKLAVQKLLSGEYLESDLQRIFQFTLMVDDEVTPFTLVVNEVEEFEIPVGSYYEVREQDYSKDGFYQHIANGFGTATNTDITVVVTNTYVGIPYTEITGQKLWELNGGTEDVVPESITVQLKNGDELVEEKTVIPDDNGEWHYSFTVPKYDVNGNEVVYTVTEIPIAHFRANYDGYNITNTYVAPILVDPPIITKVVTGDEAPESNFEFVFMGQHGTPMPEGSEGYRKVLMLTGTGELEIGAIRFDCAGTYVYSIYEKNLGEKYWTYDTALYTVTVVVTEVDHVLSSSVEIKKSGNNTDSVVFTNSYEEGSYEAVVVSGTKIWEHGDNPEASRPTSIIVKVYGDSNLIAQREVTESDGWTYSFELPRFRQGGYEIIYTVDEAEVEDYSKQIDGYNIINTYIGTPDIPTEPDEPTDPSEPDIPESPQTGDNSNIAFWFAMMILSLVGMIVTMILGRKPAYRGKYLK